MLGLHAHRGGKRMKDREVAESYAQEHGLTFLRKGPVLFHSPSLGASGPGVNAILGPVAHGPPGILCQRVGYRADTTPWGQYEISGLGDVIEGLWVHDSGRSIWTRVALPKGYTELILPSEAFTARYRVAISSDRDEEIARRLLSGEFLAWFTDGAIEGGRFRARPAFEIWQGVLFIRGPGDAFRSPEKLDAFAAAVARIATEVAALANSPGS
jgi:hypothetical protein